MPWHRRKYDHRHYFQTTEDWITFSQPALFPGGVDYSHIDGMLFDARGALYFLYKGKQRLFLRRAESFGGRYSEPAPLPAPDTPIEGGFALKVGSNWRVYFDQFLQGGKYGYIESADLKSWSEPQRVAAPFVMRHGSFVALPMEEWRTLVHGLKSREALGD